MKNGKRELFLCVLAVVAVSFVQFACVKYGWTRQGVWVAMLSMIGGGFMVSFGFWGADYAHSVALGELDQSKQRNGLRGAVYVPFMRNYTSTEWWNLSWFVTFLGFVIALGGSWSIIIFFVHAGLV